MKKVSLLFFSLPFLFVVNNSFSNEEKTQKENPQPSVNKYNNFVIKDYRKTPYFYQGSVNVSKDLQVLQKENKIEQNNLQKKEINLDKNNKEKKVISETNNIKTHYHSENSKKNTNLKTFKDFNKIKNENKNQNLEINEYELQKKIEEEKELSFMLNSYLKNRKELKLIIDKKISNKEIDIACANYNISEDFFKRESDMYKNFYPEVNFGNFKVTQNYLSQTKNKILSPNINEIVAKAKENNIEYNKDFLEKNVFVIEVKDKNLFKQMTNNLNLQLFDRIKHYNFYKNNFNNLQIKNLNDLTLFSTYLEGKNKKDFFNAVATIIEFNSLVCVY